MFRCDRCVTRKGLWRIHTWYGATRLAAREELADRAPTQTYSTAPFQPTRPNDRPTEPSLESNYTIPVLVSSAPPQLSAATSYPRSTSRRASLFTPGLIPGPDRRGRDPVESDTCRMLYLHAYQHFSFHPDLANTFITRFGMRYEAQNNMKACWGNNELRNLRNNDFWENIANVEFGSFDVLAEKHYYN